MPVTTTMLAPTETPTAHLHQPTSCTKCQECGTRVVVGGTTVLYWPLALDKDLLQTISSLFPHWFKDCNLNDISKMSDSSRRGSGEGGLVAPFIPLSPPKCEVDDSPLQGKALNKNKESLKVKLMLRRPREDLVSRGVIPPMNTPAAFYEQRQRLDMAKKHDILKHKMQRRPLREELVRQHILEDSPGNIDPSLVEKQKQLKRARIADAINDHLCQRPGPLELVKANILHTSEDLEKAVKEGQLMFKSTCEGEPRKHPSLYLNYEDESSSESGMSPEQSEGGSGRSSKEPASQGSHLLIDASSVISNPPSVAAATALIQPTPSSIAAALVASTLSSSLATSLASGVMHLTTSKEVPAPSPSLTSNASSLSPLSSLASPQHSFLPSPQTPLTQTLLVTQSLLPHALTTPPQQNSAPGKDQSKSRKKCKGKCLPKARTIKFHEYKGPPSAVKREHNSTPTETSYDILLQQQQLFLQCQLELKQKYTQIILPASVKPEDLNSGVTLSSVLTLASSPALSSSSSGNTPIAPAPPNHNSSPAPPPPPPTPPDKKMYTKLEDLKVSDLKLELKKRNLPVSGSKPQLIERLKFHTKTLGAFSLNSSSCNSKPSNGATSNGNSTLFTVGNKEVTKSTIVTHPNRTSIDLTDDSSVVGLFDSSMEAGDESVLSPAYSHISSTRPSSVAPMEVDFDTAMDVSDLGPISPLNSATPLGANSNDSGSINTPPPPPPPPPPPVSHQNIFQLSEDSKDNIRLQLQNGNYGNDSNVNAQMVLVNNALRASSENRTFSMHSENQDGILHLTKKIEDLQRELHNTQIQLQTQQKQNMLKAKENYQNNIYDPKFNQKAILQHQIESRKHQQQQQQLQSHLLQLQQNLQNERMQLQKDANDESPTKDLDDLIILSTDHNQMHQTKICEQNQNHLPEQQQYFQFQHLQEEPVNHLQQQPQETLQQEELNSNKTASTTTDQLQHQLFQIGDVQVKVDSSWGKALGPSFNLGLLQKNQRSSSIVVPNGIIVNSHHRTASLPNFSGLIFTNENLANISERLCYNNQTVFNGNDLNRASIVPKEKYIKNDLSILDRLEINNDFNIKPPPNYSEATKSFNRTNEHCQQSSNESFRKPSYKSQQVDDVLEILIKNGELPPSAAQDPITPTTTLGANGDPFYISVSSQSPSIPPPPPPPPPPSASTSHKQMAAAPNNFPSLSSPSLFADLVMGGNSPAHLGLPIDLDLPVLEGMEMGSLESHVDPAILQQQVMNSLLGRLEQKSCVNDGGLSDIKMEVGEDVDVSSWLDSLVPSSQPSLSSHFNVNSSHPSWANSNSNLASSSILYNKLPGSAASSGVCSMKSSSSASSSTTSSSSGLSLNQCDPLLCSNPDQIDLFSMEDVDLRPPHATSDLSWDRHYFPT